MHDMARAIVAEDRVVLVLPSRREAAVAPLLVTVELFGSEVPAAGALVEIAANGPLIADLRRADVPGRLDYCRIEPRDQRVLHQVHYLDRRADPESPIPGGGDVR